MEKIIIIILSMLLIFSYFCMSGVDKINRSLIQRNHVLTQKIIKLKEPKTAIESL